MPCREAGAWIEIPNDGAVLTLNAKTGWREVEIRRGSSDQSCPVHAFEQWLLFAKINFGPVFVGTTRDGKKALAKRLNDKHVARLIKRTVLDAGIRSDLPETERLASSPATLCAPASPARQRSTSATSRSSSGTRLPR